MRTPAVSPAGAAVDGKVVRRNDRTITASPALSQALSDLGAAAFGYASRGRRVFPLRPRGKVPLTAHGFHDATTDQAQVRAWWRRWPDANIGLATGGASGLWVLDIDGDQGLTSLAEIEERHGTLPQSVRAVTGGGGLHVYFRWPADGPAIRNSASRIAPRIDARGEGGYVVVPPSVHPNGRRYRWTRGCALVEAPEWLVDLAAPPPPPARSEPRPLNGDLSAYVEAVVRAELAGLEAATEGVRNHALNRAAYALAGLVKAGALEEDWTRAALEERALTIGLPTREVRRTIASAFVAARPRELPRART